MYVDIPFPLTTAVPIMFECVATHYQNRVWLMRGNMFNMTEIEIT